VDVDQASDALLSLSNADVDDPVVAGILFGSGTFTNLIDSAEFDVSGGTGSITINDGGDAGNVSIEGTVLDINSLDFVGAGTITSGANNQLQLTSGSGEIDLTTTGTLDLNAAIATLDVTDTFSIDGVNASNITLTADGAADDLTISVLGAQNSSLVLSSEERLKMPFR